MTAFMYDNLTMALINLTAEGRRSICADTAVEDFLLSEMLRSAASQPGYAACAC